MKTSLFFFACVVLISSCRTVDQRYQPNHRGTVTRTTTETTTVRNRSNRKIEEPKPYYSPLQPQSNFKVRRY